jgi:hypothetical protein
VRSQATKVKTIIRKTIFFIPTILTLIHVLFSFNVSSVPSSYAFFAYFCLILFCSYPFLSTFIRDYCRIFLFFFFILFLAYFYQRLLSNISYVLFRIYAETGLCGVRSVWKYKTIHKSI